MTKRQKALIILFTPFVIGFLLGFCIRGSFNGKSNTVRENEEIASALPRNDEEVIRKDERIRRNDGSHSVIASDSQERGNPSEQGTMDTRIASALPRNDEGSDEPQQVIYYRNRLQYAKLFADTNEEHLSVAKSIGLSTIPKVRKQVDTRNLRLIEADDNLIVDNLRYSIPYLTKNAANELNRIAKNFADSLISKGFPKYRLIVSSVLRTEEDVNRLRRSGNPNASSNSAHCYGTTFDITYTRYEAEDESEFIMQPFELTKVLGEVLLDEKNAGRILVKYERQEHCFHITAK